MIPIVHVNVTIKDGVYKVDGYDTFEFENGVQYVLNSTEDLWVTWKDKNSHDDKSAPSTVSNVIDLFNLTTHEHHQYVTDNLIYQTHMCQLSSLQHSPVGRLNFLQDPTDQIEPDRPISETQNDRIAEFNKFLVNSTQEEILNIQQTSYKESLLTQVPFGDDYPNGILIWNDDGRYIGISLDGVRIPSTDYTLQWRGSDNLNRIALNNTISGAVVVKSDLMHYCMDNGSKAVTLLMRPGDERKFYINDLHRTNTDYVGRGREPLENQTEIKQLFDDWLLDKYPGIYDFLLTYSKSQDMRNEAQAFLRNMDNYKDIDTTTDDIVKKLLRNIFTPFETVLADKRLLFKKLNDFFKNKGNPLSYMWLSNVLFKKLATIERYSERMFRLDSSEWIDRHETYISLNDLNLMNTTENRVLLGTTGIDVDSLAKSLVGFTVVGRKSKVVGLIEVVKRVSINNQEFWKVHITVKSGSFDQNERIDVSQTSFNLSINPSTINDTEIGIVGYEIEIPGSNIRPGQEVISVSTTGHNFLAEITSTNNEGGAKTIRIDDHGWFYRNYQDLELRVLNNDDLPAIPYDVNLDIVQNTSLTIPYVVFDGDFVEPLTKTTLSATLFEYEINNYTKFQLTYDPSTIIKVVTDSNKYYVVPTADGIRIFNVFGFFKDVDLQNPSIIRGLSTHNNNILIAYETEYKIYLFDDLNSEDNANNSIDVAYDGTQTGVVTGCFMYIHELIIFTNDNNMWRYENNVLTQNVSTPAVFTEARMRELNGIKSYIFYDRINSWVQQSWNGLEQTKIIPKFGRVIRQTNYDQYKGNHKHQLSSFSKLQDNDLIQDFSMGINLDVSTNQYMATFDNMINPSGYKIRGHFESELNSLDLNDIRTKDIVA